MNIEKLQKMAGSVRTGGKGSVRRHVPLPAAGEHAPGGAGTDTDSKELERARESEREVTAVAGQHTQQPVQGCPAAGTTDRCTSSNSTRAEHTGPVFGLAPRLTRCCAIIWKRRCPAHLSTLPQKHSSRQPRHNEARDALGELLPASQPVRRS